MRACFPRVGLLVPPCEPFRCGLEYRGLRLVYCKSRAIDNQLLDFLADTIPRLFSRGHLCPLSQIRNTLSENRISFDSRDDIPLQGFNDLLLVVVQFQVLGNVDNN